MKIVIFTDGAARGNPDGPGGYGAIVRIRDKEGNVLEKELSGGFPQTTNNRMELMAPIAALEALGNMNEPCEGLIFSDSRYLVDAFEKNWIRNWQKNGWVTSSKSPVKNQDLWVRLIKALAPHRIRFRWVKGHADHPENERCDKLATAAADRVGWSLDQAGNPFSEESEWKVLVPAGKPDTVETKAGPLGETDPGTKTEEAGNTAEGRSSEGWSICGETAAFQTAGQSLKSMPAKAADSTEIQRTPEPAQTLRIRYLSDRIEKLQPPTDSANWIDLRVAEEVEMKKGDFRLIRLGVAIRLPEGYEAHVVPRSSTYKNFGLIQANHYGVIDHAYCGDGDEWMVPEIATRDTKLHVNDRICQFRIERRQPDIIFEEVDRLGEADRGGFGSTGIQ